MTIARDMTHHDLLAAAETAIDDVDIAIVGLVERGSNAEWIAVGQAHALKAIALVLLAKERRHAEHMAKIDEFNSREADVR